jgi:hypothetical protein
MTAETIPRPRPKPRTPWLVPAALILLSLVPVIAGASRLTGLAGGQVTPDNARFFDSPIPVLIHIPAVTVYLVLGAFQFVPSLRRGKRGSLSWHKIAGRILAPTGLLAALSGLWMAVFYDLPPLTGRCSSSFDWSSAPPWWSSSSWDSSPCGAGTTSVTVNGCPGPTPSASPKEPSSS